MTERRTIGQILKGLGRISEEDVATALEYQRDRGGYFGEALIACRLITREELDFGIASQFDLPYVVPDPDSVDPAAASLVSPDWALAHSILPLLQTGNELRVVTDSPMREDAIGQLEAMTGLKVALSLSSPQTIRAAIRQVYARASATEGEPAGSIALSEALDGAMLVRSPRFGISVRGARARFWWDEGGAIRRRGLRGDWRDELDRVLSPSMSEVTGTGPRNRWEARLQSQGGTIPVSVDALADESGREVLFTPGGTRVSLADRFPLPVDGILSEVRLLARSGTARFIVQTEPEELGHEVLPHLPLLLLDASWRSVYISARDQPAADEAFSVRMPDDPGEWADELAALRSFHFDVVTADLSGGDLGWAEGALDIASVAFLLWPADADTRAAREAGIRWTLQIRRSEDGLEWSLEALNR